MKQKKTPLIVTALAAISFALPAIAEDDHKHANEGHEEHGAHVHGSAQLNVARIKDTLVVDLDSPAANIVGFEHAPRNAQEKSGVQQAIRLLEEDERLLLLPAEAECVRITSDVETDLVTEEEAGTHEEGEHQPQEAHVHSDFEVSWEYRCDNPDALTSMDVQLFRYVPDMRKIEVQYVTPTKQGAATLTPNQTKLTF